MPAAKIHLVGDAKSKVNKEENNVKSKQEVIKNEKGKKKERNYSLSKAKDSHQIKSNSLIVS